MKTIDNINVQALTASLTGMLFTTTHCIKHIYRTLVHSTQGLENGNVITLDSSDKLHLKVHYFSHKNNYTALEMIVGKKYIEDNEEINVYPLIEEIDKMIEEIE